MLSAGLPCRLVLQSFSGGGSFSGEGGEKPLGRQVFDRDGDPAEQVGFVRQAVGQRGGDFPVNGDAQQAPQYDVAPDGRVLINPVLDSAAAPITLLMNWNPEAKK